LSFLYIEYLFLLFITVDTNVLNNNRWQIHNIAANHQ
jgi:hypothetical protein